MVIRAREGLSSPISLLRRASTQPKQSWTSSYAALFDWSHKRLSLSLNLQYGGVNSSSSHQMNEHKATKGSAK